MAGDQSEPTGNADFACSKKLISSSTTFSDSILPVIHGAEAKDSAGSCSLKRKRPLTVEIPNNVLREIQVEKEFFGFRECEPVKDAVCFSDSGFAVFSLKGKKKFMEDAYKIASCPTSKKKFFGVYDGHGGSKAAEFVAENLHSNIFSHLQNSSGNEQKEEAIKYGYLKTDKDFLNMGLSSGACCVTALIEDNEVIVSNIGDCRAVLCRGGKAEALTTDHRAGVEDERRRIEEKGGFVLHHKGAWRVHGVLSVSRSIGDSHLKDWVLAEPDTKIINLTQDMDFLVLASDGLWEKVSNEEAAEVVGRFSSGEDKMHMIADANQHENIISTASALNAATPSPKLRRVLIKSKKTGQVTTGSKNTSESWKCNNEEDAYGNENDIPPSKARRISTEDKIMMNNNQENAVVVSRNRPVSGGLVASACKELTNLAVSRGSLDDITVMIIDLSASKISL